MIRLAMGVAACLSLAGCALGRSPLATTWVLDPLAPRAAPAGAPVQAGVLSVERVRLPDWLDRPQLVGRGGDGSLELDERARWGEPLGRGLQRVMAENLASLLVERRVVAAPAPPQSVIAVRLSLDFVEAVRHSDGELRVEVRWELQGGDGRTLGRGLSTQRIATLKPGPAGAVAALNQALFKLASELSEIVRRLSSI